MADDNHIARARGQPVEDSIQVEEFPYHYGLEADNYTFYRVPKILFSEHEFSGLSTEAKMLYGLMLDRMQLSARNNWVDESGRIYIFFKIESIMTALSCGNKKACSLLAELDDRKGIGLISRVKQGMGRPDRIYVRKCITEAMSRRHFMKCQNDISCSAKTTSHDMSEPHRNNTEMKNIEINDTESIVFMQYVKAPRKLINYKVDQSNGKIVSFYINQDDNMFELIRCWVNERNHWMHQAGNENISDDEYKSRIIPLAIDGMTIYRELCDITTKIKRSMLKSKVK